MNSGEDYEEFILPFVLDHVRPGAY